MDRSGGPNRDQIYQMLQVTMRDIMAFSRVTPPPQPLRRMTTVQPNLQNRLLPSNRPQLQVNFPGTSNQMASNRATQYMPRENRFMQYQQAIPQSNGPNQSRNWNANGNSNGNGVATSSLRRNSQAPNTPQSGQANDPSPPPTSSVSSMGAGSGTGTGQSASMDCAICSDDMNMNSQNISSTPCGHLFCTPCIIQAIRKRSSCPLCKTRSALNDLRRIYLPARN